MCFTLCNGNFVGRHLDNGFALSTGFERLVDFFQTGLHSHTKLQIFVPGRCEEPKRGTNLLLLRAGYMFTGLVSHEKLIEARKADYYLALNKTQSTWKTDAEDIYPWMTYFLEIVKEQATEALAIIQEDQTEHLLSEKQLALWQWVQTRNELAFSRKDAIEALGFPPRTVEAIIKKLTQMKRLERIGEGRATRYRTIR